MSTIFRVAVAFSLVFALAPACIGDDYNYDGQTKASNVEFKGETASIKINGQSQVAGACLNENTTIVVWIDGGKAGKNPPSSLTISGKCKKLIITRINGQTTVDASALVAGSVEILDMNGQTTVRCNTKGRITVKAIDGQSHLYYKKYSNTSPLITHGPLNGQSSIGLDPNPTKE
jgi:Putative auto-transporter adhesin, head GIN domain